MAFKTFIGIIISASVIVCFRSVSCQQSTSEWKRLGDALYLVESTTEVIFDEAQTLCQDYDANLARVDSDEIQAFLTTLITPALENTRCFSIGADDRQVEDQFLWLDGTPVRYDGWAPQQPDDNHDSGRDGQDCACLWSNRNQDRHGRWDDAFCHIPRNFICQRGAYDFQFTTPRTNPGFASVSCAVRNESSSEIPSPEDVKLSIGQSLSSSTPVTYSKTRIDGGFRNNSFLIDGFKEGDKIFCYIGELPNLSRSFSLATLSPVFPFYALPVLTSAPTVAEISSSSVTIYWSSWTPSLDSGDGPVLSYLVYLGSNEEEWTKVGGIDTVFNGSSGMQRIMEFVLTGLAPGSEYNISVSAVREGQGGEGPRGTHVKVRTTAVGMSGNGPRMKGTNPVWTICAISLVANIILVFALVILWKRKQRKEDLPSLRASPAAAGTVNPKSHDHYELPRPSIVMNHAYQDLKAPGKSTDTKEAVYADIDGPQKLDYVNLSPEVLK